MSEAMRDLPVATRLAPIEAVDAASRTIEVIWAAGALVERYDWMSDQRYVEELVMTDRSVRLGVLNAGAPVLDNHDRYGGLKSMLAVVERAWIESGKGLARVRFPKEGIDPAIDTVFAKIADRVITKLSCGYRRLKIEVDKSKAPQVWRVVDWEPFEISFVTVPADPDTDVRAREKADRHRCLFVGSAAEPAAARMRMRTRTAGLRR